MKDPAVAPFSSGYPAADRSGWPAFLEEVRRTHGDMWADFDAFCREHGEHGLSYGELGPDFIAESPWLNLYSLSRPRRTTRASARSARPGTGSTPRSARRTRPGSCPSTCASATGPSSTCRSGSLGSADVGLMQRLVDLLATTEHRVIVSKGPLADQITLHDNQTGEGFLPQPAILPQVDLVITHGGNNTVTEAFHHGKPMIVLPLFWDQVDNAQRVDETGFGRRLSTYDFRDEELTDAIDELLDDRALAGAADRDVDAHQGGIRHRPRRGPDRARGGTGSRSPGWSPALAAVAPRGGTDFRRGTSDGDTFHPDPSRPGGTPVTDTLERVKTYQQFIGGEFVDAADGKTADVINPANDAGHRQRPGELRTRT